MSSQLASEEEMNRLMETNENLLKILGALFVETECSKYILSQTSGMFRTLQISYAEN